MKMKNSCYIFLLLVFFSGCRNNTVIHNNNIVNSYTDSIYETSKPYLRFVYENVKVLDKQTPNEIFFYDQKKNGHLLMGDIVVKNTSDTVYVKR